MEELKIYKYQAKRILDTMNVVARVLESKSKESCLDRDIMQSIKHLENVMNGEIDQVAKR